MKLGRNDICHCGSGRKYKKCCMKLDLAQEREEKEQRGSPAMLGTLGKRLVDQCQTALDESASVQSAKQSWINAATDPLFLEHACFDLCPIGALQNANINTDPETVSRAADALSASYLSILEVTQSKRAKGIELHDHLTGKTAFVSNADLATQLEPMEVIIGRLGTWDESLTLLPSWEKLYFRGRKAAIRDLQVSMSEDGIESDDETEIREAWVRRSTAKIVQRAREATPS